MWWQSMDKEEEEAAVCQDFLCFDRDGFASAHGEKD
jgi:hypothetical protein